MSPPGGLSLSYSFLFLEFVPQQRYNLLPDITRYYRILPQLPGEPVSPRSGRLSGGQTASKSQRWKGGSPRSVQRGETDPPEIVLHRLRESTYKEDFPTFWRQKESKGEGVSFRQYPLSNYNNDSNYNKSVRNSLIHKEKRGKNCIEVPDFCIEVP